MDRRERILGGLLGVAMGDAMGMPSEMWPRERIRAFFGEITTFLPGPAENAISHGLRAGETTDDTANTMLVAEMLVETGGIIDPIDYLRRLKAWTVSNDKSVAVTGPSTARAIALVEQGVPVEETGRNGTTNGAAMKIAPVGLISDPNEPERLVERVELLCMPTHNTGTAIGGACAVAMAYACAVRCEKDWAVIWERARTAAELGMQRGFYAAAALVTARLDLAAEILETAGSDEQALDGIYTLIGTGLAVNESVPAALAVARLAQGDPVRCARYCANLGGDTDTIGSIACGLCGTMAGPAAFPQKSRALLESVNQLNFAATADALARISG